MSHWCSCSVVICIQWCSSALRIISMLFISHKTSLQHTEDAVPVKVFWEIIQFLTLLLFLRVLLKSPFVIYIIG